jgi:hypothetical protein
MKAGDGDIEFAEGMEVGGDDFVDGAVIGAEEAFAGEAGGAEAFFEGFVCGCFFHFKSSISNIQHPMFKEDPHGLVPWVNEVGMRWPGRAELIHPPRKGEGV